MNKQDREATLRPRPAIARPRGLSRARAQLEQRVGAFLAKPLGQLQSLGWLPPALGGFSTMPITRDAQAGRMREVLERDRALSEASPLSPVAPEAHPFEVRMHEQGEAEEQSVEEPAPRDTQVTESTATTHAAHAPADRAAVPTPSPSGPPAKPRAAAACSEPIRTRTMAKLLLSQGHAARALSIYDALIAAGSSDPVLLAEADALRSLQT